MANQKEQLIAKIATGTFSDEVLEQAMLALTPKAQPLAQAPSGFLSEAEARKFCGNISRSTLWIWRRQGLRSYRLNGRRLFLPEDLKRFVIGMPDTPAREEA